MILYISRKKPSNMESKRQTVCVRSSTEIEYRVVAMEVIELL